MTRPEPSDFLRNERCRPKWKQEGCRCSPTRHVLFQYEGGHLQRLRQVAGKATVVLAGHDAVEPASQGETSLCAKLADNGISGKLIVRVQTDRDRTSTERS